MVQAGSQSLPLGGTQLAGQVCHNVVLALHEVRLALALSSLQPKLHMVSQSRTRCKGCGVCVHYCKSVTASTVLVLHQNHMEK